MSISLLLLLAAFILTVAAIAVPNRFLLPAAVLCIIVAALVGDASLSG